MIRLDIASGTVQLRAQDQEFGWEATEKIACEYSGGEIAIGFNSVYLIDILTHLEGDDIEFRLSVPTKAGLVAPTTSAEREDVIMLVMPVRLNA